MAELGKVIKGLEKCLNPNLNCYHDDIDCPYATDCWLSDSLPTRPLKEDALELLKAYAKTEEEKQAERKQKRREWQAKYRESHRQQAYQNTKKWRKNNPDKVKEQRVRRRERQRAKRMEEEE